MKRQDLSSTHYHEQRSQLCFLPYQSLSEQPSNTNNIITLSTAMKTIQSACLDNTKVPYFSEQTPRRVLLFSRRASRAAFIENFATSSVGYPCCNQCVGPLCPVGLGERVDYSIA